MNIHRINSANAAGIYKKNHEKVQQVRNDKAIEKDDLILSPKGKIFNLALKAVAEAPEVNKAKLSRITEEIKSKNYSVNSNEIADRIIKGSTFDKKI